MPVTLVTAALCGLLYFWLSLRVVEVRRSAKVSLGDGGDEQLLQRIRFFTGTENIRQPAGNSGSFV